MAIRPAASGDVETLTRFNAAMACETEQKKLDLDRLRRGVEALLRDPAKGAYFVAEAQGRVVGQVLITYEWSDWRNGNFWWLQSVYVDPAFRGQGVFKQLFAHVDRLARRQSDGCGLRLYVDGRNHRAQRVYQRLGLRPTAYQVYESEFRLGASPSAHRGPFAQP